MRDLQFSIFETHIKIQHLHIIPVLIFQEQ